LEVLSLNTIKVVKRRRKREEQPHASPDPFRPSRGSNGFMAPAIVPHALQNGPRALEVRALVQSSVGFERFDAEKGDGTGRHPSPGEHHATRSAVYEVASDDYDVVVASGADVFAVRVNLGDGEIERGKENVLKPTATNAYASSSRRLSVMSTGREIQSLHIAKDGRRMLIVDNYGVVDVIERKLGCEFVSEASSSGSLCGVGKSEVEGASGWCGVVADAEDRKLYVTKGANKTIDIYDGDRKVRRMRTLLTPYDIDSAYGTGGRVVTVTEGHQLAIYDERIAEKGGCAHRISLGYNKPLYALSTAKTPGLESIVACGGSERVVHIIDVRKWGAMDRWRNAVKFDITQLELSTTSPGFAYVAGLDYECMCGNWQMQSADGGFSFRADARWMGLSSCVASGESGGGLGDILAGWSESGHVYAARTVPCVKTLV